MSRKANYSIVTESIKLMTWRRTDENRDAEGKRFEEGIRKFLEVVDMSTISIVAMVL